MAKIISGKSIPSKTIPGKTIPGKSVPKNTVPGKTVPGKTVPGVFGGMDKKGPLKDAPVSGMEELLGDAIKQLYWTENHLTIVLPKVRDAAGSVELKQALADHLKVTKQHAIRLESIFGMLGLPILACKSDAMEGLAMEGESVINSTVANTPARDRGLIMACQKVEHYEMAAYRGLALLAEQLGKGDIAKLLNETLAEEEAADNALGALAQKG